MEKVDINDKGEIKLDVVRYLMGFFSKISGLERIEAGDDLFDIGATSLTMAQMVEVIQKTYNVTVPIDVILEDPSINAIAAYVAEKAKFSEFKSEVKKQPVEKNIELVKEPTESIRDSQKIIRLNKAIFKESAYQKGRFKRNYVKKLIPFGSFSSFLSLLSRETIDGESKYLHPTAGGLNAVQTYIYIKENSIEGFERGIYYYHPEKHVLYLIHNDPEIEEDIFFEYDRPFFHNAGFVLFFIAQLDAITPVYQGVSPSLVTIDAGYMGQLLLSRQSEFGMGVCPVVGVDFERIASYFKLDKGHRFIHCMLGGTAGNHSLQDGDKNEKGLLEYIQKTGKNITNHLKNYTGDRTFAAFLDFDWKNNLKNMKYLNKEEHDNFHSQHLNIRKFSENEKSIPLEKYSFKRSDYTLRSCRREYLGESISFEKFSKFMNLLSHEKKDGMDYSLYPSVSGIYGIHIYVYIRDKGVEGLDEGIYYYNPRKHELVLVTSTLTKKIKPSYTPFNRKQYQQSAFCLYLISKPDDIKHLYNDDSLYLSLLEAGYLGQLLMDKQAEFDIGVCPIGGLDFERIRPDFKLDEGYKLLHSFTCGGFVQEIPEDREFLEEGKGNTIDADLRKEKPSIKRVPMQYDLAIVGISGRYPGARNMDEFWDILKEGKSSISDIPEERKKLFKVFGDGAEREKSRGGYLEDIDSFDSLLFNISPSEARITDPQERLFLEIAWECLENAGYTAENLLKTSGRIGVFVGAMWNDYQNQSSNLRSNAREVKTTAFHSSVANRVSYFFNFTGPSIAVNTSCSSAMTALHFACESIKRGECDAALVGGVNLLTHTYHEDLLLGLDMLSKDGQCRPFGAQATGWLPGEGVGAVLIKPVEYAERDKDYIHGVIKGTSIGHSGRSVRFGAPNTVAQEEDIKRLIEISGVSAETISYIEAAAAGSSIADASEINAIKNVFEGCINQETPLLIGSVKGSIGHLESASAISQLAKVLLQMKHHQIVPSVNSSPVNSLIQLQGSGLEITDVLRPWSNRNSKNDEVKTEKHIPLRAIINAFGATGSGGHIILEEYIHEENRLDTIGKVIIPISAASENQLNLQVSRLYEYLKGSSDRALNLADIGYTLKVGRIEMDERLAIVAENIVDLIEKLQLASNGQTTHGVYRGKANSDKVLRVKEDKENIHSIAEQWVNGAVVEWNLLKEGKRIPLPTYPFAKVKHWYEDSDIELSGENWSMENRKSRPEDKEDISEYETHEDSTLLNKAENYLKKIFSDASEVPLSLINVKSTLDKYGINSIMIAKLNSRLEKDFGELPKTLFFEYQTIHELAGYFLNTHSDKLALLSDVPISVSKSVTYRSIPETTELKQNGLRSLTIRSEQENKVGDIAIIGLSGRYPKARTMEEFWENLKNGIDCISEIPVDRWDYKKFF
ncbi:beta-ketoacyl synthase N-terminal-like domain-containing protein [Ruminiclostridium josui]|nr:beta-ketoacyl synthase N-terminal-like domain-containing protein [Ruminiclostridium josui]